MSHRRDAARPYVLCFMCGAMRKGGARKQLAHLMRQPSTICRIAAPEPEGRHTFAIFFDRMLSRMCERYVIPNQEDVEREFALAKPWWKFSASFNVSSARNIPVIRVHQRETEGVMMRWGFIPQWAKDDAAKHNYLHAHAKDLDASEAFRFAWRNSQRCILPLAGFYGWQLTPNRYRQPYFVRLVNRSVFGFAGIWDRWVNEDDDDVIESCALIVVPSNPLMAEIHNSEPYMPAILRREDYQAWLTGGPGPAKKLLRTYPQDRMVTHAVSPRINSLKFDDPGLIEPTRAEIASQLE